MKNTETLVDGTGSATAISVQNLFSHWMGHQKLTRKVIETFPEDKLFSHTLGGMRSFGELVMEIVRMGGPGLKGLVEGSWPSYEEVTDQYKTPETKEGLLKIFDQSNKLIATYFQQIESTQFEQSVKMFNQYEGPVYWSILYFIDNEIHHRAQGYVYLRSLGIEPPPFWER